jgi:hypothetical protein
MIFCYFYPIFFFLIFLKWAKISYLLSKINISNAAEEEIASRSEAISDGAESSEVFDFVYTPTHTHTHTPTHTPLHKTLLGTYMRRSKIISILHTRGKISKFGTKKCIGFLA